MNLYKKKVLSLIKINHNGLIHDPPIDLVWQL